MFVLWDCQRKQTDLLTFLVHHRERSERGHICDILFSLFVWSQLLFSACIFPFHIWASPCAFFFFPPETVFPEMCSFPTTPSLRAMCPPPLLNSFALFPPSLCLVLPDNLFYSRQSSSPLQLSLLILLNCRPSFSLRKGGEGIFQ